MEKVVLRGYIYVTGKDLEAVRGALPEHVELTLAEPGCLIFQVTEDPHQAGLFSVYEAFDSPESFQAHQNRVQASYWGKITVDVRRDYEIKGRDTGKSNSVRSVTHDETHGATSRSAG